MIVQTSLGHKFIYQNPVVIL